MKGETVFILLFVVATAVAIIARHLRVPYTVALLLAGLGLGVLHAFQVPHLTKELLFSVILPGLLFEAAFHMESAQFWRNRLATLALAVPGVAAAIGLTAAILVAIVDRMDVAHGFTWQHALVFGTLLAATDPIAVIGLFRTLGAPQRLSTLIQGESLLNDGTSIVFFSLVLEIVGGGTAFSLRALTIDFLSAVGIGVIVGAAAGLAVSEVMKRIDDPMIEITLTTIAAYGAFITAEQLHASGVISTVAAGVLCGSYGARVGMSPSTRVAVETFWEYVAFALNSVVFLLMGFEVHVSALLASWQPIGAAYLAVLASRAGVIAVVSSLLRPTRERMPPAWGLVLTWGGLRGALSMVLALSLPLDFPFRDLLITMTFGVVIATLLVQGLTMAPLLRWLGVATGFVCQAEYALSRGRAQAAAAALEALELVARTNSTSPAALEQLRREYRERIEAAERALEALPLSRRELQLQDQQWLRRRLLLVEKTRIIELTRQGALGHDSYERLMADIDGRLLEVESGAVDDAAALADHTLVGEDDPLRSN
jgi:CPA1 family monovalent cation:H+ antiporter